MDKTKNPAGAATPKPGLGDCLSGHLQNNKPARSAQTLVIPHVSFSALAEVGFGEALVPIIPPDAKMHEQFAMFAGRGKAPGIFFEDAWAPKKDWLNLKPDIERWDRWNCGAGLRSRGFPAVDIDVSGEELAADLERMALQEVGLAPVRVGQWPKRLLPYRLAGELFTKRVLLIGPKDKIEILADGQQYVTYGVHPGTKEPYRWLNGQDLLDFGATGLTAITAEQADAFLRKAAEFVEILGYQANLTTSGREASPVSPEALQAPNVEAVRDAVAAIENDLDYDAWIALGRAIKAACAGFAENSIHDGFDLWAAFSLRLTRNVPLPSLDECRYKWDSFYPPHQIGWHHVATVARDRGFNDARLEFDNVASPNQPSAAPPRSEDELALRMVNQHSENWRYVATWGRWLKWDGTRWCFEETLEVFDLAREICRQAAAEANKPSEKSAIASARMRAAVENLARADRRCASTIDQWDTDPWALVTPGGTIDLTTGTIRPNAREDHNTKSAAAGPGGESPTWLEFLDRITDGDADLVSFLQRFAGYSLTGRTDEQCLVFLYGTGANGKSVFVNTISGIMGDYHTTAPIETFTASASDRHPTELAGLRGARLVTAIETEEGRPWAESKIKALTGGDKIAARFMRQDFFEFTPNFKLLIAGNHKPTIRTIDEAIRRRIHLVPFNVTIPPDERDPRLAERLREEWPGILRWAVQGAIEWQRRGLCPPAAVRSATAEYLSAEDALERWILDRCHVGPGSRSTSADLWRSWLEWCLETGEHADTQRKFFGRLSTKAGLNLMPWHDRKGRGWSGIQAIIQNVDFE